MHIYALVGTSGTGKSHHAIFVAHEYQADMIIDDGLLIKGSRIIAGRSAKRADTMIGAVKTALFSEDAHAEEVREKINELHPDSILILGTSVNMIEKITRRLNLPYPETFIKIEDISSPQNIKKAQILREQKGTHVVPAPTVEVKQKFSGTIIDPLISIFHRKNTANRHQSKQLWVDHTIVKPTFNYFGRFFISNDVIGEIVKYVSLKVPGIDKITKVSVEKQEQGILIHADVWVVYGYFIPDILKQTQKLIEKHVVKMTSLNILSVDLHAVRLIIRGNELK